MFRIVSIVLLAYVLTACSSAAPSSPSPMPSPIVDLAPFIGMGGYPLLTNQDLEAVPAGARVSIIAGQEINGEWRFTIITENGLTANAVSAAQLQVAPGYVAGEPTPIARFGALIGRVDYPVLTLEAIGAIPANTRVRVSSARHGSSGWLYTIVPIDEQSFEEARENQLDFAEGVETSTTVPPMG